MASFPYPLLRRPSAWIAAFLMGLVLAGCAATPQYGGTVEDHVAAASQRFDIPQEWIYEVMRVESGMRTHFDDGTPIVSHAGAMGLMQVMPGTYDELRRRYDLGPDPHNPRDNIMAGTAYIREMYDMFGSPGFLAAYNAGPGRYLRYVNGDSTLPSETQRYVAMIAPRIEGYSPSGRNRVLAAAPTPQPYQPGPSQPAATSVPEVIFASTGAPALPSYPTSLDDLPANLTTFQIRLLYPELVPTAAAGQVSALPVSFVTPPQ